jgi:hypothetical protein
MRAVVLLSRVGIANEDRDFVGRRLTDEQVHKMLQKREGNVYFAESLYQEVVAQDPDAASNVKVLDFCPKSDDLVILTDAEGKYALYTRWWV